MPDSLTAPYTYRMTSAQRLALTLAGNSKGAFVVEIDTGLTWVWSGTGWSMVSSSAAYPSQPITSSVQSGRLRVTNLFVDAGTGKLIVEYDNGS